LQRVDDLLDGHLTCEGEPEDLARDQLKKWQASTFESDDLDLMAEGLQKALPDNEKIVQIVEEMILDRRRVRENRLLSEQELKEHLQRTFALSLDLMLAASEAEITSADAPALISLLGWCSVVRDLEEDISLGLVNIPEDVFRSGTVAPWFESELKRAEKDYRHAEEQLLKLKGKPGVPLLTLFHRSVKKYLKKHEPNRAAQMVRATCSEQP
jgi:phytoene/squalene synthetase